MSTLTLALPKGRLPPFVQGSELGRQVTRRILKPARGLGDPLKTSLNQSTLPLLAQRVVALPEGRLGLNLNGLSYRQYLKDVMPHLPLTATQRGITALLRWGYQGIMRNTLYRMTGNPCRYMRAGNLSCSEFTLILNQLCGSKRAIQEGWRRIADEDPYLAKHPILLLGTMPLVGSWLRHRLPAYDYTQLPTSDAPIPIEWLTPGVRRLLAV